MNDHKRIQEMLGDLHDGEVDDSTRQALQSHIKACPDCRHAYERLQRLGKTISGLAVRPESLETERFVHRVMSRLRREETSRTVFWWKWLGGRWAIPALSLGFAALILSILLPQADSVAPPDVLSLVDHQEMAQLVLPPDPTTADNIFSLEVEDK